MISVNDLYRELSVWKRMDQTKAVQFHCLQNLNTGKFAVLSANFYYVPPKAATREYFQKQFVELFIELDPKERIQEWHPSIEEAIASHEAQFASMTTQLPPDVT